MTINSLEASNGSQLDIKIWIFVSTLILEIITIYTLKQ